MRSAIGIPIMMALVLAPCTMRAQVQARPSAPYGNDPNAGQYAVIDGVRLYYETYGEGPPLVLLHGNGGSIAYMAPQIAHFARNHQVIAMDCRGRGKSELGKDSLTYERMTSDLNTLLELLHVDSAYVIGRSDGGIIALLLAIHHPAKVKKVAAFGANVSPDTTALFPKDCAEVTADRTHAEAMMAAHDTSQDWRLVQQRNRLMEFQPHISATELGRIQCPVLILSTDRDVIKAEHTLFIYTSIPKANLCIFPGKTHGMTKTDAALFNGTVEAWFNSPYKGREVRE